MGVVRVVIIVPDSLRNSKVLRQGNVLRSEHLSVRLFHNEPSFWKVRRLSEHTPLTDWFYMHDLSKKCL